MIQFTSIVKNSDSSWTFVWTSTGASSYRVVLFGEQQQVVSSPTFTGGFVDYTTYPPPIEVVEAGELALSEQFPPTIEFQWYGEGSVQVSYYLVQQFVGGVWEEVGQISEANFWVYTFQPRGLLADETFYSYEILAVNSVLKQSDPEVYDDLVVTPPLLDESTIAIGYNSSGTSVTVGAV